MNIFIHIDFALVCQANTSGTTTIVWSAQCVMSVPATVSAASTVLGLTATLACELGSVGRCGVHFGSLSSPLLLGGKQSFVWMNPCGWDSFLFHVPFLSFFNFFFLNLGVQWKGERIWCRIFFKLIIIRNSYIAPNPTWLAQSTSQFKTRMDIKINTWNMHTPDDPMSTVKRRQTCTHPGTISAT